jgi:hypothetical protein
MTSNLRVKLDFGSEPIVVETPFAGETRSGIIRLSSGDTHILEEPTVEGGHYWVLSSAPVEISRIPTDDEGPYHVVVTRCAAPRELGEQIRIRATRNCVIQLVITGG